MRKFEVCKGFENAGVNLPVRSTALSAGYDVEAIEDVVIPSIWGQFLNAIEFIPAITECQLTDGLDDDGFFEEAGNLKTIPAHIAFKPSVENPKGTLVKTGLKAYCNLKEYVALVSRSSGFNKKGLILANSYGVGDADYPDNPENDGHLQFNFINFGFTDVFIQKGERIGQILFVDHNVTDFDRAEGIRRGGWGSTGA